jgi:hypothetical protein
MFYNNNYFKNDLFIVVFYFHLYILPLSSNLGLFLYNEFNYLLILDQIDKNIIFSVIISIL